jgi:hypothetical protein
MYGRFAYLPDPRWLGWRDPWYAAAFAHELLDRELAQLDQRSRRPSKSRRWRAPRPIRSNKVRPIMRKLKLCLKHRESRFFRAARDDWQLQTHHIRSHRLSEALSGLIRGFATVVAGTQQPAATATPDFRRVSNNLSLSKVEIEQVEMEYRLNDFTGGRADQITDENVGLACLAACEINKYQLAHEIALRALGETVPRETCALKP